MRQTAQIQAYPMTAMIDASAPDPASVNKTFLDGIMIEKTEPCQ